MRSDLGVRYRNVRRQYLDDVLDLLSEVDHNNAAEFSLAVQMAWSAVRFNQMDLAKVVGVGSPAVSRWVSDGSVPHRSRERAAVVAWLIGAVRRAE